MGQVYLLTDENRLAVATAVNAFQTFEKQSDSTITYVMDGGGATRTTGIKGDIHVPCACVVGQWTLIADQTGSAVVDIWRDSFTNAPPVVGDSITASAKPTISSAVKAQSSTLTGWTTSIPADSVLRFNLDSVTAVQRLTLSLRVRKA